MMLRNCLLALLLAFTWAILQSQGDLIAGWYDQVAVSWDYPQRNAFYDHHKLVSLSRSGVLQLHSGEMLMKVSVPFVDYNLAENCNYTLPLNRYLQSLRIFYASHVEFANWWNAKDNAVNRLKIVSLDSEQAALQLTLERLRNIGHDYETSNPILFEYLRNLSVALSTVQSIIERPVKELAGISMDRLHELSHSYLRTVPNVSITYLDNLLHTYFAKSLLPFLDQLSTQEPIDSPEVLYNEVDESLPNTRLLLISRNGDAMNGAGGKVALYTSARLLFSVALDYDVQKAHHNPLGYGALSTSSLQCIRYSDSYHYHAFVASMNKFLIQPLQTNKQLEFCFTRKTKLVTYNNVMVAAGLAFIEPLVRTEELRESSAVESPLFSQFRSTDKFNSTSDLNQWLQTQSLARIEATLRRVVANEQALGFMSFSQCEVTEDSDIVGVKGDPQSIVQGVPRILSLGTGTGEFHLFLLAHFPCMVIDSLDISHDAVQVGRTHGGFGYSVCSHLKLTETDDARGGKSVLRLTSRNSLGIDSNRGRFVRRANDSAAVGVCRSNLIIGDAWRYMEHIAQRNEEVLNGAGATRGEEVHKSSRTLLYDVIAFDVYDAKCSAWEGESGKGNSLPEVERATKQTALQSVWNLLRPYTGVALFHLHNDSSFEHYYTSIVSVFEESQVAILASSTNDNVVVATRDRFRPLRRKPWHCSGGEGYDDNEEHEEDEEVEGTDEEVPTNESSSSGYTSHPKYRSRPHPHPCEDPKRFAEEVVEFSRKRKYHPIVGIASKYTLNCNDKLRDLCED